MLSEGMYSLFEDFPVVKLEKSVLRQLTRNDASDFFRYMTNPNVKKYLSEQDCPISVQHAEEELSYWGGLFSRRLSFYWGIADKDTNKLIGSCGYNVWNKTNSRVELSYDLDYSYWGMGIMTEAVSAITDFAFSKMKVVRSQATVVCDNLASIRLLEKCGYIREGVLANYAILGGKVFDSYMYGKV